MSNHMRYQESENSPNLAAVLARIEAEMADGYVEVAPEGLTFRELVCLYAAMLREGRDRMLGGVRSLFRLHPAH